jgi:hypothetical protein
MHKLGPGIMAALLLFCAAAAAHADVITQTRAFNLSSAATLGGGGDADVLLFNQFDATAGTLDSVDVFIDGQLTFALQLPASFVAVPAPTPVPYAFDIVAALDFGGQASDFLVTPGVRLQGPAPGGPAPFPLAALDVFTHSFSYTAASDLAGLAVVTTTHGAQVTTLGSLSTIPPGLTSGLRQDFDAPGPGIPLLVAPQLLLAPPLFLGATEPATFSGVVSAAGTVRIVYNFTPNPPAVPEPAALVLLVAGGTAAWARRRRWSR